VREPTMVNGRAPAIRRTRPRRPTRGAPAPSGIRARTRFSSPRSRMGAASRRTADDKHGRASGPAA
jgi:hypothetical protein